MLLIENVEGVRTRRMPCSGKVLSSSRDIVKSDSSGAWCAGTSYVTFEDVQVPVENIIGRENKGFAQIMSNFNHERLVGYLL